MRLTLHTTCPRRTLAGDADCICRYRGPVPTQVTNGRGLGSYGDSEGVLDINFQDKFSSTLLSYGLAGYDKAPEKILVTARRSKS
jgi:hypothetical protein